MNILFQKQRGDRSLGIEFFWMLTIDTKSSVSITDHFIPELFYDYFFIREGKIRCVDKTQGIKFSLPKQALKTIHTHPLIFIFSTPLVLFGARLSLGFAESFWEKEVRSNSFIQQNWADKNTNDLSSFRVQVTEHIQKHRRRKMPYPMLTQKLEESSWLVNFSPRHKRRLYKTVFGISRKEMSAIRNVHSFLEQTCDFASENPRIIQYVNADVFHDQPHLNHAFKKMTGFTPVEYFEANSILQDNLMSASYNEISNQLDKI